MKASVPKLFFCPGSASYTPVTQGSRWRVASRQLRKPTTPSALAFFVVERAPSGFPFGCAVQNPITPLTPTLPTRPPLTKNTDPQSLSDAALPLANPSPFHNLKAFQREEHRSWGRCKAVQPRKKANQRHSRAHSNQLAMTANATNAANAAERPRASASQRHFTGEENPHDQRSCPPCLPDPPGG